MATARTAPRRRSAVVAIDRLNAELEAAKQRLAKLEEEANQLTIETKALERAIAIVESSTTDGDDAAAGDEAGEAR